MPPAAAAPNCPVRWATQPPENEESTGTEVSAGSLPVIGVPLVRTPLPASAVHQNTPPVAVHSVDCCAPYFATEKPQRLARSFGDQPMVGIVMTTSLPAALVSATQRSADDPSGRFCGAGLSS